MTNNKQLTRDCCILLQPQDKGKNEWGISLIDYCRDGIPQLYPSRESAHIFAGIILGLYLYASNNVIREPIQVAVR